MTNKHPRRSVLLYAIRIRPVPRLAPRIERAGRFSFHRLSHHLIVSSRPRLVSRVEYSGAMGVSSCPRSDLVSAPPVSDEARQRSVSSSYLIVPVRRLSRRPAPSRSSSRVLVSSGRLAVGHPVSSHQMRAGEASKTAGASHLGSVLPFYLAIRAAGGSSPSSRSVPVCVVIASSSHPRQASRRRRQGDLVA